jgi:hypothetical protein
VENDKWPAAAGSSIRGAARECDMAAGHLLAGP